MTFFKNYNNRKFSRVTHQKIKHLLITLTMMYPAFSSAQALYQIEAIIFERRPNSLSNTLEQWSASTPLSYPSEWQHLINPDEHLNKAIESTDYDQSQNDTSSTIKTATEESFVKLLPPEQQTLSKTKQALIRNSKFRILFHNAWIQPITPPEKAPAIILNGGDQFGDHHELQGYIKIGFNRFILLQTDLWLSQFDSYSEVNNSWIEIPKEPSTNLRLSATFNPLLGLQENHDIYQDVSTHEQHAELPTYGIKEVAVMQERRRMRTGELHYIDHPRLGMIIKATLIK